MSWWVRTNDLKHTEIAGDVAASSPRENLAAGGKKLALSWLAALVSVLVPVAHFILVPAFFFIGIFLFFAELKQTHVARGMTFQCPQCSAKTNLKSFRFRDQRRMSCAQCGTQLEIVSQKI